MIILTVIFITKIEIEMFYVIRYIRKMEKRVTVMNVWLQLIRCT